MPRTKQVTKGPNKNQENREKAMLIEAVNAKEAAMLDALAAEEMKLTNLEAEILTRVAMTKDRFSKYLHIRLADLDSIDSTTTITTNNSMRTKPKLRRSISDTAINKNNRKLLSSSSKTSTLSNGSDSGNSTSSSISRSTSRSTKRSGSATRTKADHSAVKFSAAKTRRSRSLSRSDKSVLPPTFGLARSTMRTPMNVQRHPMMTPITPKMKNPDITPAILRRPNRNEIAVSMQGSPLRVDAVTDGINANIPLRDGRVISLQPQNMRLSDIADLSLAPECISDLQQLRDNIAKLCTNFERKAKK